MRKRKIVGFLSIAMFGALLSGCQYSKAMNDIEGTPTIEYVTEISADAQFDSKIGVVTEQPVYDKSGKKIGKRLFVESSKELLNEQSLKEFYAEVLNFGISYNEILISLENNEVIEVLVDKKEVWYCTMNDEMQLTKIKKIYSLD